MLSVLDVACSVVEYEMGDIVCHAVCAVAVLCYENVFS